MERKIKQPKGKKMNSTFFVFCEGKTEAAYVDLLHRNFHVSMEIIVRISHSSISQAYIERCKKEKFSTIDDKTFLMFDLDVTGMFERLNKINNVILLLSNPCIEYWFMLHYKDASGEMTSSDCVAKLKKHAPDYIKGVFSTPMARALTEGIEVATKRALAKAAYSNPSSTVYLLTNEMMKNARISGLNFWSISDLSHPLLSNLNADFRR